MLSVEAVKISDSKFKKSELKQRREISNLLNKTVGQRLETFELRLEVKELLNLIRELRVEILKGEVETSK